MKIVYLIPLGGYSTELRSDTLWGMLCWGIRHLWGSETLVQFIRNAAEGRPEFVISSTFPYKQHGTERIPFFPNPHVIASETSFQDTEIALESYRLRKKIKNVEWLSLEDFSDLILGNFTGEMLLERVRAEYHLEIKAREEEIDFFPSGQTVRRTPPKLEENSLTHNTIDRLRGGTLSIPDPDEPDNAEKRSGQLFHSEELFWRDVHNESDSATPNTGLFFLVDGDIDKIIPILRLLRHHGYGADRTTGKGFFDFHIEDFKFIGQDAEDSNAIINLSLFRPTQAELAELEATNSCLQYLLERREGYVGGYKERHRKKPRLYFKEGSIFKKPTEFSGRYLGGIQRQELESLPHEIWDNGFGFMVNLKWKS